MTPKEFKKRWESDDNGGGITYDDIAECAKVWRITQTPRIRPIHHIRYLVLKAANTIDAEEFKPDNQEETYD